MIKEKKVSESFTEQYHIVMSGDINGSGRLFGGKLLSWIDEIAGIVAMRHCGGTVTTVAIDNLRFKAGAYLNDVVVSKLSEYLGKEVGDKFYCVGVYDSAYSTYDSFVFYKIK